MKKIAVLGSTGSIGTQTLEIVRTNKDIQVTALAAGSNIELLEAQIREFSPKLAAVWDEEKAVELKSRVRDLDVRVFSGMDGLLAVAADVVDAGQLIDQLPFLEDGFEHLLGAHIFQRAAFPGGQRVEDRDRL